MKNFILKKKGFTLIEIIIVLGIIGLVAVISVASYGIAKRKVELDIAADSVQSLIAEARDKSKSGYTKGEELSDTTSLCFGIFAEVGRNIELFNTPYNKLNKKCEKDNLNFIKTGFQNKQIFMKEIYFYGEPLEKDLTIFFKPPYGEIEFVDTADTGKFNEEPLVKFVIGYRDLEGSIYLRQILLNIITGNVYAEKVD
jgi:prepilin-type N-terminal cleavage/methylation domain-containing protein